MFLKGSHHEIPITSANELKQGSQITVLGPKRTLEEFSQKMGYEIPNQTPTDIAYLSLGLLVGMLLGKIVFSLGGIPITFGEGGGCLFSGLFFGWYRTRSTYVGTISPSTRWFLKSMGLNVFIACVALESGAQFFPALKEMGVKVLFIGMFLSLFPHLVTLLFSHFVLKLSIVENLGALSGVGTLTAALNSLNEETESSVFSLFYTPTYAIGNILLTLLGPIVVFLLF